MTRGVARWLWIFITRSDRRIALLLFCCYFFLQSFFLASYGATWDEPLHRNWGKIFLVYLFNGQPIDLLRLMPGGGMYYSPIFFTMSYIFSEFFLHVSHLQLYEASHLANLVVASAVVGGMYLLSRSLQLERKESLLSVLFLIGFPQFIAHSHYNPKDIPLLLAVLCFSIAWCRALRDLSKRGMYFSAFLFGAAIAMKITAVLLLPAVLVSYLYALHRSPVSKGSWIVSILSSVVQRFKGFFYTRESVKDFLLFIFITVFLTGFGLFIFWPSAWFHPSIIVESFAFFASPTFWSGQELYFGNLYRGADLPWHYTMVSYLVAMPSITILSFFIGLRGLRTYVHSSHRIYMILGIVVPLVVTVKPGIVRYDGMRQFFFILPFIVIIATVGFLTILRRVSLQYRSLLVGALVMIFAHEIFILHPYEGSYRNEFVRFLWPQQMEKQFEIEYWGPTYREGVRWLNEHAVANAEVCIPISSELLTWYDLRSDLHITCSKQTTYLMYFSRYREPAVLSTASMQPVFTIERMGATLLRIYALKKG